MAVGHWAKGYLGNAGDGPAMNDIEGLEITSPQDQDTLQYDASSKTWKNAQPSSGGGVLVIDVGSGGTLNKTWQEIHDALAAGKSCVSPYEEYGTLSISYVCEVSTDGTTEWNVIFYYINPSSQFPAKTFYAQTTDGPNGYPVIQDS